MNSNKKLPKISRVDQVYSALVTSIFREEWKPGEKLPSESELADTYGVNKLTVRMALQKLNVLGLLETRVGEGSFVRKFSIASYFNEINEMNLLSESQEEIADFRSVLQIGSFLLSLKQEPDKRQKSIEDLEKMYEKMEECLTQEKYDEFQEWDYRFHKRVCQMSSNKMMINIAQATDQLLEDYTKASGMRSIKAGRQKELLKFHRVILDSLKKRDVQEFIDNELKSILLENQEKMQ